MRNALRAATRNAMANQRIAAALNQSEPNMTWEEIIAKYRARGLSGNDLWNAIANAAASKSRVSQQDVRIGTMNPASRVEDPERALSSTVQWEVDPEDVLWLRATFEDRYIYLRINNFPDENLFSFWIGDGKYIELEDMPAGWMMPSGELKWPSSARRRRSSFRD